MAAFDQTVLIPISEIDAGERYRKAPARNIDKLSASIDTLGLLHPIVVLAPNGDGHYPLVVGQRRMLACEKLGFDQIEARVAHDMDEADRLLAELDENVCRENMTPSEANACRKARAVVLAPLAEEKKQKGNAAGGRATAAKARGEAAPPKLSAERKPRVQTSESAAEGTGYSGRTLEKVEKLEQWSTEVELTQEIRDFIQGKLDELNAAEKPKVDPVYRQCERVVIKARAQAEKAKEVEPVTITEGEPVPEGEAVPEHRGQAKALADVIKALARTVPALETAFVGAENFDADVSPEKINDGFKAIRQHLAAINKAGKAIKDIGA